MKPAPYQVALADAVDDPQISSHNYRFAYDDFVASASTRRFLMR